MDITVDLDNPAAPFAQLIDQIRSAVAAGALQPGDPLPSIRQLARDLELNNKTVAKAYRLLERDSILQSRGYRGTFVHPDAKSGTQVDLNDWLLQRLGEVVEEVRDAGATDPEIRNAFTAAMNGRRS